MRSKFIGIILWVIKKTYGITAGELIGKLNSYNTYGMGTQYIVCYARHTGSGDEQRTLVFIDGIGNIGVCDDLTNFDEIRICGVIHTNH